MKEIADRMAALGSETRLEIYRQLVRAGAAGLPVSDVRERLSMPASTLSHHLHKLIRVGLVHQERQGTTLICRADYDVMLATFEVFAKECCVDEVAKVESCCPDENTVCAPSGARSTSFESVRTDSSA